MYASQTAGNHCVTIQPTRKLAPSQPQRRPASAPAAAVREELRTKAEVQHKQFRDALMEAPAIICLTRGPQHIVEAVNKLCAQSIGGADVIGLPVQEVWPAAQDERVKAMDAAFTLGEPTEVRELLERLHTASGVQGRLLNLSVQPLKDEAGAVYGLLLHAVDVTDHVTTRNELADLAGALERSNRELDSFAYAASHDLRASLRGIANLAQWIEEDLLGTDQLKSETREMLELMRGRMHRM